MNILLLNGENVQTICIARSLRQDGHKVIAFANSKFSSGYASKYLNDRYVSPDIIHHLGEFENFFCNYMESHPVDLVIPMGDDSATYLSVNKEKIEATYGCKCAVPSYFTFNVANDKQLLM